MWTGRDGPWMERYQLRSPEEVLNLEVDALRGRARRDPVLSPDERLLAVCTDARRDPCCELRGRPLAKALAEHDPGQVWECSHLGGHRFAATFIAFPDGLCFGRVPPEEGPRVADLLTNGRIALEYFRGRVGDPAAVQAAEVLVRKRTGNDRIDELGLVSVHSESGETIVAMRATDGNVHVARVRHHRTANRRPTSCGGPPVDPGWFQVE